MVTKVKRKRGRPETTNGFPRLNVRLPPDLLQKIVDASNENFVSINSEVIRRLRYSLGIKKL